jgi:hypothetical protein
MIGSRIRLTVFRCALVIGVIAAIIAQGCATHRSQDVGSLEDYEAQQNNYYAYGYGPYDPFFNGYDPYLSPWYVAPIYYYPRGDGDNDCDGGHGGHHLPLPGRMGPPPGIAHPMSSVGMSHAGMSHGFSAPAFAGGGFGGGHGGFGHR